jgi:predicted glycosyltransferase
MKILIDMGHPAHVHFFRHAIRLLEAQGHEVKVTARDKDVTIALLEAYKIPYVVRPDGWRPLNLFVAGRFIKKVARDFGADKLVGVHNPYVASAAVSLKKPCVLFTDTPGSKFVNRISVGRATKVVTPECLAEMFPNQIIYPGYKEMAYLHPSVFTADKTVLERYGLVSGKYYVVRFIEWAAHHDSGVSGMSFAQKQELVMHLSQRGKVVASIEGSGSVPEGCAAVKSPVDVHSLLAFSSGYVGEGATMAKEAAVMGIPSVYVSSLAELSPIIAMEKEGVLVRQSGLDVNAIDRALEGGRKAPEMHDVTGEVVRVVEGAER